MAVQSVRSDLPPLLRWSAVIGLFFFIAPMLMGFILSFDSAQVPGFPPRGLSLRHYAELFHSPLWLKALRQSAVLAGVVAVISVAAGLSASFFLARRQSRSALVLLMSPIVVPPIVLGVGARLALGYVGLEPGFPWLALVQGAIAFPICLAILLLPVGNSLSLAVLARSLGARPWFAFIHVTVPALRRYLVVAFLFATAVSLDDAIISLFLLRGGDATVSRLMFDALRYDLDGKTFALCGVLFALWLFAFLPVAAPVLARSKHNDL